MPRLIPLLAVPVSLVGTFMLFPMFGFSINTLSLFGLVLAIGLVVDDAIVVVEAVEHHIEHGLSPKEATLQSDGRSLRTGHRDRAYPGGGLRSDCLYSWDHRPAVPAVRRHHRALRGHLRVQRPHPQPRPLALLLKPKKPSQRPLRRFFDWFNRCSVARPTAIVRSPRPDSEKRAFAASAAGVRRGRPASSAAAFPNGFLPMEDQGYCS